VQPDPSAISRSDIAVELIGVHKRYRQRQRAGHLRDWLAQLRRPTFRVIEALRGVDLTVRRGEIVAYAGPNGAGKSTTIKLLSSLLAPDEGQVRCLGLDPVRERRRYVARIGAVFGQRTELWWDHPLSASFHWKRAVWGIEDARFERSFDELIALLDLDELLATTARELSLGQRMRADIALALLHEPELVLLDEPTLGLDVLARRRILGFLERVNRERGTTVVVTSHDMAELEQLAGRIVMIHRGEVAFDGDWSALRRTASRHRVLVLETADGRAPELAGAEYRGSSGDRHEYVFDGASVPLAELLARAGRQTEIVDVETHRPPIDAVVADLYERWQQGHGSEGD
jgi:ABC-2 type transport system ATP-binding protein